MGKLLSGGYIRNSLILKYFSGCGSTQDPNIFIVEHGVSW